MLEVKGIYGGYPKREVLHGVSLEARAGQITAILGPNGCGKSTLLKSLCGIVPPASGEVLLDGVELLSLPRRQLARKVAYLAQNRQPPDITVGRLVLHGRFPYLDYPRRYRAEDTRIARRVMEQMDIVELAELPLGQLSGGQRQKAYIAMALAQDTDVILMDEPTTYLDVSYQLQFLGQAKALAASGRYVLMVVHDLSHALETADSVALMKDGTVAVQGTPEEVYGSGALDQVFGVRLARVQTDKGWHYFCMEK